MENNQLGVLVDADVLIALSKKDDSNHQRAARIDRLLQNKSYTYYLSPFTVAEATTVLSYKVSHQTAKKFLKQIRKISLPVLELDKISFELANEWFLKQKTKGTSYFDCYNMALMERYKNQLEAIFSFDSIYEKNGFKTAEKLLTEK